MKQNLLTKHCALMLVALLTTAWSSNAWAGVTINVKSSETIYLYVWDDTEAQTPLNGDYPGTAMTATTTVQGETWYTKTFAGYDKVNFILSKGGTIEEADATKTADLSTDPNGKGVTNGCVYYEYDENKYGSAKVDNLTDFYDLPAGVTFESTNVTVYFVNTNQWAEPYVYISNGGSGYGNQNNDWPGDAMTKVGTNSNGWDVYKWSNNYPNNPSIVIFSNNGSTQTGNLPYDQNGYYSGYNNGGSGSITIVSSERDGTVVYNTPAYFSDANMRVALEAALGVPASSTNVTDASHAIATKSVKSLDISGHSITNTTGVAYFTELEELYASNNNITFADLRNATKLRILDMHQNENLLGFGTGAPGTSNNIVRLPSGCLQYIDMSNTRLRNYATAAFANKVAGTLETFIARDVYYTSNEARLAFNNIDDITTLTKLKYLDVSGCDGTPVQIVSKLANMKLTLEYLDISDQHMTATGADPALDGFTALKTFKFNTQASWTNALTIDNCPSLEVVDVTGNLKMSGLTINNCPALTNVVVTNNALLPVLSITSSNLTEIPEITGLSTATVLTKIDLTGNAFTQVPEIGGNVNTMVMNSNQLTDIVAPSNIKYLYAQDNQFASDYTLPATSLVGIDLGNNGFTKFTAKLAGAITDEWAIDYSVTPPVTILANASESDGSNTTLEAIHLDGNASLETVTINGYKGLTKLASDNDMTTDKGKGLYIKGNTAIKTLDISNNRIEILGQDNSLNGLSNLEELDVSHNKLLTLTNRSAISSTSGNQRSAYGNGEYTAATCPNIEDLTGLKKLNISYNLLSDSIHLAKNTNLEWLDASHNRTITERAEGLTQYYRKTTDGTFAAWHEATWKTIKDQYTNDLNDTIGLRMLDLFYQTKLKYLDISYTNIENTAMSRIYVNNRVGPENLSTSTTSSSGGNSVGRWGVPRFVLLNHCSALEEFHSNYNAMKSLGIGSAPQNFSATNGGAITGCPNLEVLEAIECRGQDPAIMKGEITVSVRNPQMRYYNVSNSNFDKVKPYTSNENGTSGQNLETLIIDGNYTRDNAAAWNLTDAGTLDVSNNPKLVNLQANKCPNLITLKANGLSDLDIVSVKQDTTVTTINNETVTTKLANLYVDHDAILDEVVGLETLSALSVYHANDSHFTGNFVMPVLAKSTLTDLRVGNEALSLAQTRNNLATVNLADYTAVEHLETQNNPLIEALNITGFTNSLKHINFANNHIANSGIGISEGGYLPSLPALEYFNCSNDSKWSNSAGNRLTDLILTNSTGIKEIYGNNNDLHYITGSFSNLTNIEFAHNHINGINLSAAPTATVNSEDNGRDIVADFATFKVKDNNNQIQEYKVYFFQLDATAQGNGTVLTLKESKDSEKKTRVLGEDGFVIGNDNIAWTTENSGVLKSGTITPGNMSGLDPDEVPGKIVVLQPTIETGDAASGTATYTYATGNGDGSLFYLNWESNGTPTAISEINAEGGVSITNTYGNLTVTGADGTVVGVYDLNGRLVASETISGGTLTIDGLAPGIYVVNGVKVVVK